jgi:biopolymer transport protein ExbB
MARKAMLLRRTERADQAFMHHFRQTAGADIGTSGDLREFANSTLYRIYRLGLKERDNLMQDAPEQGSGRLSPEALQAVRATLGAEMVREATRLNGQMVMLTLSISGAPFLGLLGTVIGIMITFGTIALAGDVNVNTIAPGVAAALICTVAGLIVAIPVLFGYNFLTSHIKDILARMEVFAEELVGKFAVARAR